MCRENPEVEKECPARDAVAFHHQAPHRSRQTATDPHRFLCEPLNCSESLVHKPYIYIYIYTRRERERESQIRYIDLLLDPPTVSGSRIIGPPFLFY